MFDWKTDSIVALANDLPVGVWVARVPSGELVYANQTFTEIMGMAARGDVAVGHFAEPYGIYTRGGQIYPEELLPFVRAMRERTTVIVDDISIHRGDGRRVDVRAIARPLFEAGELKLVAIAFFDVTAEVEAVRAKDELQARLKRIIDCAPIILFSFDTQGIVTLCEGRGLESIGLKPGQLVGQDLAQVYKDSPAALAAIKRALSGEEFHDRVKAGPLTFETTYVPLRNAAGDVVGVTGVSSNVTERESLHAQLIQSERMASLGTIASSVAHEVNTPLAYVASSLDHVSAELDKVRRGGKLERIETLFELVQEARKGVDRVKTISRDLNVFSRPHEREEPVDVRAVLQTAIRMASNETSQRARLVQVFHDVPQVMANETRLAQVFLNLLVNAAQSITEGASSQNEIRVSTWEREGQVVVEVSDSGPGVEAAILPRIFDPFFTTRSPGQGTGLGLSICQDIVQSLGGTISAANKPEGGATFQVSLPSASNPRALEARPAPTTLKKRPRVLIVDDNPSLLKVLELSLKATCELEVVSSGSEALTRLLQHEPYDVVLCDLMMPDISGIDVFERLRAARPPMEKSLCFMTGGAFTPRARQFLAQVHNPCFEKPFDFGEVILRVLAERQVRDETRSSEVHSSLPKSGDSARNC